MDLRILKQKDFSLLMFGKAVSLIGSNMQQFALSLYVLAVTGSATIFASMLAISILPRLLLSPVAGVFGDWFDRKKSIVTLDLFNSVLIGGFALLFWINGELSIPSIYVLVILLEASEIFFGSAMSAVIPSIVKKEELFQANSIKSVVVNGANMLSPLMASILYAIVGIQIILIINSISFFLSALSELAIKIPATHKKPAKINLKSFKRDFQEGVKLIKENKMIMNIIGIGVILNFALAPLLSVALLFVILETLGGTEMQYGLFVASLSFAMLLSPVVLGGIAQKIKFGKLLVYTFLCVSGFVILLGVAASSMFIGLYTTNTVPFVVITGITFLIAMVVTLSNIALGTLFETIVPKELMGRTGTTMNLCLTIAMPLGQMIYGVALDILQPSYVIGASAVVILLSVLYYRKPLLAADNEAEESSTAEELKRKFA